MNRIIYIVGRITIALGALAAVAPVAKKILNMTWI
jgi:hypothetical protein